MMPHGHCYLWQPELVSVHAISDFLIALAYFSIPVTLVVLVRQRHDLPFSGMFLAFGLFIVSCGATHLMAVWNIWNADYWLSGGVKVVTAAASLATAGLLIPLLPRIRSLPRPAQLRREIQERVETEKALRQSEFLLRQVLETLPVGVQILDRRGRPVSTNPAGQDIWGHVASEGADPPEGSRQWWADTGAPVQPEELAAARAIQRGLTTLEEVIQIDAPGGERKTILHSAVPILKTAGEVQGAILVAQDITDRTRKEAAWQSML